MVEAANGLVGVHDFASFCRRRPGATTVREVYETTWFEDDDLVVFEVRARAFCHQMVRSMVGFCVDVGLGSSQVADPAEVIAARDRTRSEPLPHLTDSSSGRSASESEVGSEGPADRRASP